MLEIDPHQPGPVVHGVAKPRPKRQLRQVLSVPTDNAFQANFRCQTPGLCTEHEAHKECGRIQRVGSQDIVYEILWHFEPPVTIRSRGRSDPNAK